MVTCETCEWRTPVSQRTHKYLLTGFYVLADDGVKSPCGGTMHVQAGSGEPMTATMRESMAEAQKTCKQWIRDRVSVAENRKLLARIYALT